MGILNDVAYDLNPGISTNVDAAVAAVAGLRLMGYAIRESAGSEAVATVIIVHGATGAAAAKVVPIELAASNSKHEWFGDGIPMPNGISIDVVAGTVDLTLFYKTLP